MTGTVIMPEQLLGTEDEVKASKEAEANQKIAELQQRMEKARQQHG